MFSHSDDTIINYHSGTKPARQPLYLPYSLRQKYSYDLLLSAYTVVRSNCEEACSQKLLGDLSDDLKQEYRTNTNITQINLKTRNDPLQGQLDGCIRRCFVKRLTNHFGKEVQDYVYATAFEYQQNDFHFFDIHPIHKQQRTKKLKFPDSDFAVADKVLNL